METIIQSFLKNAAKRPDRIAAADSGGARCGLLGLPKELPVFYGGSITTERQNELYSKRPIDGVMINSSEMTPEQFVKMTADTQ
ncbi:MAG: triose-phosphate isomerase [Ruminococcus sp.]|nr:triose-phosphate isomerase [Ruminococcus sp.]